MKAERTAAKKIKVVQGRPVTKALHRAVRHALLEHKRAGNTVAAWREGRVVLIPAAEIVVEAADECDESARESVE